MRTTTLLFILTFVVLILLTFPEKSHEVIFVLTNGKVSKLKKEIKRKEMDRKRKKQRARRNRKKKRQRAQERRKLKELKRWFERFSKKNKNADHGDRGVKKKTIWGSTKKSLN